ncbi:MAG: hypothetical protein R3322_00115 [Kiloniellales bacterium]|nr:hypothetical protein [Kiloniellales bacterium]
MGKKRRIGRMEARSSWPVKNNKKTRGTAADRIEWVREQWRNDPHITINGKDGMNQRLLEVFGVAMRAESLMDIRSEVRAEAAKAQKEKEKFSNSMSEKVQAIRESWSEKKAPPPLKLVEETSEEKGAGVVAKKKNSSRSRSDTRIRREWARRLIQGNPSFSNLEVMEAVRNKFGIGMSEHTVTSIRGIDLGEGSGRTKSMRDVRIRLSRAKELLRRDPDLRNEDLIPILRREFGLGISPRSLGDIRRVLGIGSHCRQRYNEFLKPGDGEGGAQVTPSQPPSQLREQAMEEVMEERAKSNGTDGRDETIRVAVQMLIDELPNLRSLRIDMVDGKPRVSYDVEIRSVESGEVQL